MITSNKTLTISGTVLVCGDFGELIAITIALLITFKDALTPDCAQWRNDTTYLLCSAKKFTLLFMNCEELWQILMTRSLDQFFKRRIQSCNAYTFKMKFKILENNQLLTKVAPVVVKSNKGIEAKMSLQRE